MRLRTWTATSISVARRSSVCERSPSPITRLNRLIAVSARARFVYPEAFCHALRPRSAMSWRWRSRCVGSLAVTGVNAVLIVRTVAGERGDRAVHLVEQGPDLRAIIHVVGGQRGRHDLAGVGIP